MFLLTLGKLTNFVSAPGIQAQSESQTRSSGNAICRSEQCQPSLSLSFIRWTYWRHVSILTNGVRIVLFSSSCCSIRLSATCSPSMTGAESDGRVERLRRLHSFHAVRRQAMAGSIGPARTKSHYMDPVFASGMLCMCRICYADICTHNRYLVLSTLGLCEQRDFHFKFLYIDNIAPLLRYWSTCMKGDILPFMSKTQRSFGLALNFAASGTTACIVTKSRETEVHSPHKVESNEATTQRRHITAVKPLVSWRNTVNTRSSRSDPV